MSRMLLTLVLKTRTALVALQSQTCGNKAESEVSYGGGTQPTLQFHLLLLARGIQWPQSQAQGHEFKAILGYIMRCSLRF